MVHVPILLSTLTAGMMLAASPIVSATSPETAPGPGPVESLPAQNANMLPLTLCGERREMVADLDQQFDERPLAIGQVDGSAVVEILVSGEGSWTILATGTDGTSCIVSAGEDFEAILPVRGVDT